MNEWQKNVSVPLRGLWFLSYVYQLNNEDLVMLSFRPLAGIMVLINCFQQRLCRTYYEVSVPLRGLWFLSLLIGITHCLTF